MILRNYERNVLIFLVYSSTYIFRNIIQFIFHDICTSPTPIVTVVSTHGTEDDLVLTSNV